ncbi:DUF58 domain-containing protein [Phytopseudomonas seleniipraecipitans]|uniref:Uncharacterized conserved protein, DUF58 family, contains vWF domain n=1 Tax=Phytopseudomonas seleniipraecipitans TaxID=640205 RepID=A0A1G7RL38_9GAMM|nr:DUF58 domain-containing protein [Pseudomonas seleniipraecipitans]SDG11462.1 Uncharacterized conserved protein, DUF58 family, contains vWF domain [Pseudomonas seleniipraecipitans]
MTTLLKRRWSRWLVKRIPAAASVQLNQRRIFILPSRVGLAFFVALLVMLLAAINYQSSLAYGLTFLLGSVFVITILHTYRNLAGLVLHAGGAGAVFAGEQARLRVRLESRGRGHEAVALGWPPADTLQQDVPAGSAVECELNVPTERRGWLQPGRMRVESRFPLGLLVAWSLVDLDQAVLVYPRPLEGELPLAAGGSDDDEEQGHLSHGQGSDDFQGLRTYQPGDSRKRLHWKAYSRGQGLLVKDFAAQSGRDLLLDFEVLSGDVESRLSLLCHWVLVLSERQQPFALHLPGSVFSVDTGERHREQCLRALALHGAGV